MKYKYLATTSLSFKDWLKINIKNRIYNLLDLFVKPTSTDTKLFFIMGCGHSGTTLLATLLSRNPEIFTLGYETKAFLPYNSLYIAKKFILSWDKLAKQFEKGYLMEKTPKHILCIDRIFHIVPHTKIIIVVRDGRDVVASLKKRFGSTGFAIDRWVLDNKPVSKWQHDKRIYMVKYEDLVINPKTTLKNVCNFLGMDYNDDMIISKENPFTKAAEGNMILRSKQVSEVIYNNTGKWKNELTHDELSAFWEKGEETMHMLNYQ
ncbi:MAG: sulfotransferase [Balneolales bacterium]